MCGWRDILKEILLETKLRWFQCAHMQTAKAEHAFSIIKWKQICNLIKQTSKQTNNKTKIFKLSEKNLYELGWLLDD